jgi:parallel beta-helix repeat protein
MRANVVEVEAPNGYPVHNLNTGLNYTTIQEAIDANETLNGHSILVDSGQYNESIQVSKSLILVGESRNDTIIDGGGAGGTVVSIKAPNVTISGFSIKNSHRSGSCYGVKIQNCSGSKVVNNIIKSNWMGILLEDSTSGNISLNCFDDNSNSLHMRTTGRKEDKLSSRNFVTGNHIKSDTTGDGIRIYWSTNSSVKDNVIEGPCHNYGIEVYGSSGSVLKNNTIKDYKIGLFVDGNCLDDFILDIDESNTVDGKPVYYLIGQKDLVINQSTFPNVGCLALINSTGVAIEGLNLESNGQILLAYTSNSEVIENRLTSGFYGLCLKSSSNNVLQRNIVTASIMDGIILMASSGNIVLENNITGSEFGEGIVLSDSSGNLLRNNTMVGNRYGFGVRGYSWHFFNDIDFSNTINGRPICYWVNKQDAIVPPNVSYVALVNCTRITVEGLNLTRNHDGIALVDTTNTVVTNNYVAGNAEDGIMLLRSSNNNVSENILTNNECGVTLEFSSDNRFFHNSFLNNWAYNAFSFSHETRYANIWDDGYPSGGNYWSDYNDIDLHRGPYQNETGSDGIWDHPYVVDQHNKDNYPLTKPYVPFGDLVKIYFPYLIFDEEEQFFPTNFFYDDANITNNPMNYNLSWPLTLYVHTVECHSDVDNKDYLCLQYWFYYSNDSGKVVVPETPWTNETTFWPHPHDWESIFVFLEVQGTNYIPKWITYFHHVEIWVDLGTLKLTCRDCYETMNWQNPISIREPEKVNDTHPVVHVARHSHASYPHTVFDYVIHLTTIGIEPGGEVTRLPCPVEPCDNGTELDYDDFQIIYSNETSSWPDQFDTIGAPWNRTRWDKPENLLYSPVVGKPFTTIGLHESGSKLYLHVYDNQSRHVGKNYLTNETETGIHDSCYEDLGNTTFIILLGDLTDFTIVVDAKYAEEDLEDYQIIVKTYRGSDCIDEGNLTKTISRGERQEFNVGLSENGEIIAIPEFTSLIILPLFMIATLLTVIVYRKKRFGMR